MRKGKLEDKPEEPRRVKFESALIYICRQNPRKKIPLLHKHAEAPLKTRPFEVVPTKKIRTSTATPSKPLPFQVVPTKKTRISTDNVFETKPFEVVPTRNTTKR